ncbi:MAG TPA: hypothetical protein VHB72_04365 [Candidatus Saccharimonadales bacterium]|nr:hypothetical protein [Candidatus Saccharimonadales bacterium]
MNGLVLHPQTARLLIDLGEHPPQAIALVGPAGIGKFSTATHLAELILGIEAGGLSKYGYATIISPEGGKSISIEAIRQLERFLNLKVPNDKQYNRVAIIENSHLLTAEAQNALLKTLEEPPAGTVLIMTADRQQSLLPTIQSRLQVVTVRMPGKDELEKHFIGQGHEAAEIGRVYAASGGSIGLMSALLNEEDHALNAAIAEARTLLSQTLAERLITVDGLSKDRARALDTVNMLSRMANISLQTANGKNAERWKRVLAASYKAAEALMANAQPKLALTELVLQF